jgi:hypothetical protein
MDFRNLMASLFAPFVAFASAAHTIRLRMRTASSRFCASRFATSSHWIFVNDDGGDGFGWRRRGGEFVFQFA